MSKRRFTAGFVASRGDELAAAVLRAGIRAPSDQTTSPRDSV